MKCRNVNVPGEANNLIACFVFSSKRTWAEHKRLTQVEVVGHAGLQLYSHETDV